jgi:hypothetical protein
VSDENARAFRVERYAEARAIIQARLDEIPGEIQKLAVDGMQWVRKHGKEGLSGVARRLLTDRILERLALTEMLAGEQGAIERELADLAKEREYDERVRKPQREWDEKIKKMRQASDARDAVIRAALDRVKAARMQVQRPVDEDVKVLRRNTSYRDRYVSEGAIASLLWMIDNKPWWPRANER